MLEAIWTPWGRILNRTAWRARSLRAVFSFNGAEKTKKKTKLKRVRSAHEIMYVCMYIYIYSEVRFLGTFYLKKKD